VVRIRRRLSPIAALILVAILGLLLVWSTRRTDGIWSIAALIITVIVILLLCCLFMFPNFLISQDIGDKVKELDPPQLLDARNKARGTLLQSLQVIGSLLVLLTAYIAWRQFQANQEMGLSDRFTQAIDRLESDTPSTRLAGVYTLQYIATKSTTNQRQVIQVLAAYVRTSAPSSKQSSSREVPPLEERAPDIQAILGILAQLPAKSKERLSLSGTDLRAADLSHAILPRTSLNGAQLVGSYLDGVDLRQSGLLQANLDSALLPRANLEGAQALRATLKGAVLTEANLRGVLLSEANLETADLRGANLAGANLGSANLAGANLTGANLEGTNLRNAYADRATVWPAKFDPHAAGLIQQIP
jgi:uncharacterized protein YjbI with pentapeptide repeats